MSSSEARKEQAIVKARELEARRSATLEKDAMKLRAIDAAVRIQAGARRSAGAENQGGAVCNRKSSQGDSS